MTRLVLFRSHSYKQQYLDQESAGGVLTERKPGVPLSFPSHIHHLPISPGAGSPLPHGLTSDAARQSAFLAQPGPAVWLLYPAPALPGSVQCPVPASGTSLPLRCQGQDLVSKPQPSSFHPPPRTSGAIIISEALVLAGEGLIASHCLPGFQHSHGMECAHLSWVLTLDYFLGLSDSLNLDLQLPLGDLYQRILLLSLKQTAFQ